MELRDLTCIHTASVLISRWVDYFKNLFIPLDILWVPSILSIMGMAALSWNSIINVHDSEVSLRRNSHWTFQFDWANLFLQHCWGDGCCCFRHYFFIFFEYLVPHLKAVRVVVLKHPKTHHNQALLAFESDRVPWTSHVPIARRNVSEALEHFWGAWVESGHDGILMAYFVFL